MKTLLERKNFKENLNDIYLPDGRIILLQAGFAPSKHSRETSSQYLTRLDDLRQGSAEMVGSEERCRHNSREHSKALYSLHVKTVTYERHIAEQTICSSKKHLIEKKSATVIQSIYRRYLLRRNLIPLVLSLMTRRRQRCLLHFRDLIQLKTRTALFRAKQLYDLQYQFTPLHLDDGAPKSPLEDTSFPSLTEGALKQNARRKSFAVINLIHPSQASSPHKDEEAASVCSLGSKASWRRGSKKFSMIRDFLGLGKHRDRQGSFSSGVQEDGRDAETLGPSSHAPSSDWIPSSPKFVWRAAKASTEQITSCHTADDDAYSARAFDGGKASFLEAMSDDVVSSATEVKITTPRGSPSPESRTSSSPLQLDVFFPVDTHPRFCVNDDFLASMERSSSIEMPLIVPLPLRSLHPSIFKTLITQQRQILIDMWTLLRGGVCILKHNTSGRPRMRYLYCDADLKRLVK